MDPQDPQGKETPPEGNRPPPPPPHSRPNPGRSARRPAITIAPAAIPDANWQLPGVYVHPRLHPAIHPSIRLSLHRKHSRNTHPRRHNPARDRGRGRVAGEARVHRDLKGRSRHKRSRNLPGLHIRSQGNHRGRDNLTPSSPNKANRVNRNSKGVILRPGRGVSRVGIRNRITDRPHRAATVPTNSLPRHTASLPSRVDTSLPRAIHSKDTLPSRDTSSLPRAILSKVTSNRVTLPSRVVPGSTT